MYIGENKVCKTEMLRRTFTAHHWFVHEECSGTSAVQCGGGWEGKMLEEIAVLF